MRPDVSLSPHAGVDVERVAFDDNVLDASDVGGLCVDPRHGPVPPSPPARGPGAIPVDPRVASDEEAVVGVGRADAGSPDAGLGEDVVDRQGHHVLGFHGCAKRDTF